MKKYELTPEHRAQLAPWAERWTRIIMSTEAMTDSDRERCRTAVNRLYAAANLAPPKHIVFVPSPFVLAFAGGFAAAVWHLAHGRAATEAATEAATWAVTEAATEAATRAATSAATRDATSAATWDATRAATWDATRAATEAATSAATSAATWAATWDATRAATSAATRDATSAATWDATRAATSAATRAATEAATWAATGDATRDATWSANQLRTWYPQLAGIMRELARNIGGPHSDFLLSCANNHSAMWNGGNQWAQYVSFLSFFRHVAGLELDYSKWDHYETMATISGPRIMHPDFCMISDKPEVLTVDRQNRPHNDTGPFCKWRDGTALYAIHGVYVPGWIVEHPERVTTEDIETEQNAEVRRIMIERYGLSKYVRDAQFEIVDEDKDPLGQPRRLLRRSDTLVIELTNSTEDGDGSRRKYHVPCHPELRPLLPDGGLGDPQAMTALNAVASTYGMRGDEYRLEVET